MEWLEGYIEKFKGTVLTISHDRYFLDRVVTRIVELHDGKAEFYSGNYSFYVQEKQARFELQLKQYEKEQSWTCHKDKSEDFRRERFAWLLGEALKKKDCHRKFYVTDTLIK